MEAFLKAFAQSKIPSLLLIGIVLFIGAYIVINSKGSQAILLIGSAVILVGIVLAVISFADYRNKESVEALIQHYNTALNNISKTHTTFEDKTQRTLTSNSKTVGDDQESYSIEKVGGTST